MLLFEVCRLPTDISEQRNKYTSLCACSEIGCACMETGCANIVSHILVVVVWKLSRRWKVKTLLAGPSPTSPMRRRLPTPLFPTEDWSH